MPCAEFDGISCGIKSHTLRITVAESCRHFCCKMRLDSQGRGLGHFIKTHKDTDWCPPKCRVSRPLAGLKCTNQLLAQRGNEKGDSNKLNWARRRRSYKGFVNTVSLLVLFFHPTTIISSSRLTCELGCALKYIGLDEPWFTWCFHTKEKQNANQACDTFSPLRTSRDCPVHSCQLTRPKLKVCCAQTLSQPKWVSLGETGKEEVVQMSQGKRRQHSIYNTRNMLQLFSACINQICHLTEQQILPP